MIELQALLQEHIQDLRWGSHAESILSGHQWQTPRRGGHDDHAHPPIHPMKHTSGEPDWSHDKKALYELISRAFLATCSRSAVGKETKVIVEVAEEIFHAKGHSLAQIFVISI